MTHRVDGILVVDKPAGMTSRVALNKVWQWLPRGTRIGHAGTLDPMATGVLVACVGRGTRLVEWVQDLQQFFWDEGEVMSKLYHVLGRAFGQVMQRAAADSVSHRMAAMAIGVQRVRHAKERRGLFP